MASRTLDKMLALGIDLCRISVHSTEKFALEDEGDGRGTCVTVGRARSVGLVVELQGHERLAGCVGELHIVQDFDILARSVVSVE